MAVNLTFYLDEFDNTVTLDENPSLGGGAVIDDIVGTDTTMNVEVELSVVQSNFMYKVGADGIAADDAVNGDISFKTVGNCFASGAVTDITSGNCTTSSSGLTTTHATYAADTATAGLSNEQYNSIGTEYVLYLAHTIFGDSGAHRYFSNEADIVEELDVTKEFSDAAGAALGDFKNTDTGTTTGGQGWEATDNSTAVGVKAQGLAHKIFQHIVKEDQNRLTVTTEDGTDYVAGTAGTWTKVPIKIGDTLQVRQTIGAIADTNALGVAIGARTYTINYVVVADS
jgi:hypothetical protein